MQDSIRSFTYRVLTNLEFRAQHPQHRHGRLSSPPPAWLASSLQTVISLGEAIAQPVKARRDEMSINSRYAQNCRHKSQRYTSDPKDPLTLPHVAVVGRVHSENTCDSCEWKKNSGDDSEDDGGCFASILFHLDHSFVLCGVSSCLRVRIFSGAFNSCPFLPS